MDAVLIFWGNLITCLEERKMCLEEMFLRSAQTMLSWLAYTDIAVVCGTSTIDLAVQICPFIYTGYNGSLLVLNCHVNCHGTLDTSVAPPVVRFSFPIREGNACGSNFMVSIEAGRGAEHVSHNHVSAVQRLRPPAH